MSISDPGRGLVRRLGVTAAALLAFAAASHQRAEALSLASPGTAPSAKYATDGLTTEVQHRGHGGGGFRGGGGGGFCGGGGGGFRRRRFPWRWLPRRRSGISWRRFPRWRRGLSRRWFQRRWDGDPPWRFPWGTRLSWRRTPLRHRHAFHRPHFHHRRHFHSRFYIAPSYYTYPAYYYPRRCRVIWTYYGPRKICRPWWRHHRYHAYRYW